MREFKKKLSTKILVQVLALVIAITVSMIFVTYKIYKKKLENYTKQNISQSTNQIAKLVDSKLKEDITILNQFAQKAKYKDLDDSNLLEIINEDDNDESLQEIAIVNKEWQIKFKNGSVFQIDTEKNKDDIKYLEEAFKGVPQASNPVIDTDGNLIFALAVPMSNDGQADKLLLANVDINSINEIIQNSNSIKASEIYALDSNGYILSNENQDLIKNRENYILKENKSEDENNKANIHKKIITMQSGLEEVSENKKEYYLGYSKTNNADWRIVVQVDKDEAIKGAIHIKNILIILTLIAIVIALILTIFVVKSIVKPINSIKKYSDNLKDLNLAKEITTNRKDEIGETIDRLNKARLKIKDLIDSVKLECDDNIESNDKALVLLQQILNNLEGLTANFEQINASIEENTAAFEEINATTSNVREELNNTNKNIKEGINIIDNISKKALDLSETTDEAKYKLIEKYNKKKDSLQNAMKEARRVEYIVNIANSLLEISTNTNLLSLNAAIEAARAEKHGQGFMLVAKEVKNLSDLSAKASSDIKEKVLDVIRGVERLELSANDLINIMENVILKDYDNMASGCIEYKDSMGKIKNITLKFNDITEDILLSINEINQTMKSVSHLSNDISIKTTESTENLFHVNKKLKELSLMSKENNLELKDLSNETKKFK